jgi:multicomponent K+:H+ antiporter subunit A
MIRGLRKTLLHAMLPAAMSTVIFRTAARLLVPLSLLFGVFIFFKGHQTPGGGFVAGLVFSMGVVVHRMAQGAAQTRWLLHAKERTLIGLGLVLALATGAGSLLFGLPFLTSRFGYLELPGDQHVEWATVMGFDLGVALVVTGTVVGMINALGEELE